MVEDPSVNEVSVNKVPMALSEWLIDFIRHEDYFALIARFSAMEVYITLPEETALLYAIIQRLRPQWSLEIGTFFANTTRIMALALTEAGIEGKIITLDPFGQERVPGILASLPQPLSDVIEFRAWNSMQYFLELETLGTAKGADSPLKVVFVDGHHNFEYALFDIIRSADHLAPGGAIIIDNIEQQGPKTAAISFLQWNPAWGLFHKGNLFTAETIARSSASIGNGSKGEWVVLVAPDGIQVAKHTVKFMKRGITYIPAHSIALNLRHVSHPGEVHIKVAYFVIPYDFHITGQGMSSKESVLRVPVAGNAPAVTAAFPEPLLLDTTRSDINIAYEIEMSYCSDISENAYLLLDGQEPLMLQS